LHSAQRAALQEDPRIYIYTPFTLKEMLRLPSSYPFKKKRVKEFSFHSMRYLALWSQKEKYGVKFKIEKKKLFFSSLVVPTLLSRLHFVVSWNFFLV